MGANRIVKAVTRLAASSVFVAAYLQPSGSIGLNSARADDGFSISIDGEHVAGDAASDAEAKIKAAKKTDIALEGADIQITFDGLGAKPLLGVSAVIAQGQIDFTVASNYPNWISRSEILIYSGEKNLAFKRNSTLVATVPVAINSKSKWEIPAALKDDRSLIYALRVYDSDGRFDETVKRNLPLALNTSAASGVPDDGLNSEGEGSLIVQAAGGAIADAAFTDATALRNIPVEGGAVTIFGRDIPFGHGVTALGETIPVDGKGAFVVQRILPFGDHVVDVAVSNGKSDGISFGREINIPKAEWFYVALADLTVGKRFAADAVEAADPERYDGVYTKGRLAFYLKGRIKGSTLLTAAADTGEGKLSTLFKGLDDKDPRQFLRRIDPDDYYPVYGDDSKSVEDAPTSGKFYVRLEHKDSHVMWGNFKSRVEGNGLVRSERALYGAQAVYRSPDATSSGERRIEASAYGAQPGTLPQRDVFRGTGGSVYFLRRQDVTRGSETISVVVSDPATRRILSRRVLVAGQDYTIDYVQGIVLLNAPLSSSAAFDDGAVRDTATGSADASLAVNYEYTPGLDTIDGISYGGRIQAWVNDTVRIGATGMNETTGPADQQMLGADIRLQKSEKTFVQVDYAQTKGPGFGRSVSTDGGLTIDEEISAGRSKTADAVKIRAQAALSDFDPRWNGNVTAFYDHYGAGFTTLDQSFEHTQTEWGVGFDAALTDTLSARFGYTSFDSADGTKRGKAEAEFAYKPNDQWRFVAGATYIDLATPKAKTPELGDRTDIGLRVEYSPNKDTLIYAFGQVTADRSGTIRRNDRAGVGAKVKLTDKIGLEAEVSEGTTGLGGLAALTYDPSADKHLYVGYRLDPDRAFDRTDDLTLSGVDLGGIVLGSRLKHNDVLSTFTENSYDMFGRRRSLASTYGVAYAPDKYVTATAGIEIGRIEDTNASDFDRYAPSFSLNYHDEEGLNARIRGEARFETSEDGTRDRETYLVSGGYVNTLNADWRISINADAVISNSDQDSVRDGDYVEASLGFAYRPVENDRLNALFKYTFLYDLPGPDQVARGTSTLLGPAQRSHIMSADFIYDLNEYLSVGAKYGFRYGDISTTRKLADFKPGSAHLGILRADIHVVKSWDLLLEGRVMHLPEANSTRFGALAAVYYHVGDHMKVGVGYNFGDFSDDLTDVTQDDEGVFLNVVGKY